MLFAKKTPVDYLTDPIPERLPADFMLNNPSMGDPLCEYYDVEPTTSILSGEKSLHHACARRTTNPCAESIEVVIVNSRKNHLTALSDTCTPIAQDHVQLVGDVTVIHSHPEFKLNM